MIFLIQYFHYVNCSYHFLDAPQVSTHTVQQIYHWTIILSYVMYHMLGVLCMLKKLLIQCNRFLASVVSVCSPSLRHFFEILFKILHLLSETSSPVTKNVNQREKIVVVCESFESVKKSGNWLIVCVCERESVRECVCVFVWRDMKNNLVLCWKSVTCYALQRWRFFLDTLPADPFLQHPLSD